MQDVGAVDEVAYGKRAWDAIADYMHTRGLVEHQLASFNLFTNVLLPQIIQEYKEMSLVSGSGSHHRIEFKNMKLLRPTYKELHMAEIDLTPRTARLRGLTYASCLVVDVLHTIQAPSGHVVRRMYNETLLGRIPIMLRSDVCHLRNADSCVMQECSMDQGGYFIISGNEKTLIPQEKLHTNHIFVFDCGKSSSRDLLKCEVRSCHERKLRSTSTLEVKLVSNKDGEKMGFAPHIACRLPFIDADIPLPYLFCMLGVDTRDGIIDLVFHKTTANERLRLQFSSMLEAQEPVATPRNRDNVIEWLVGRLTNDGTWERRLKFVQHIINNETLPHIGLDESADCHFRKALFLGRMTYRLCKSYEEGTTDDRDDYAHKRLDCAGMLMSLRFRQLFRVYWKQLEAQMARLARTDKLDATNVANLIDDRVITNGFRAAFAHGNWSSNSKGSNQNGVAQILRRTSLTAFIASLRKINTPINRDGRAPKPRMLHLSYWGIVCCVETPEGSSCGLVKSLALMCRVRSMTPTSVIEQHITGRADLASMLHSLTSDRRECAVIVNGHLTGYVLNADNATFAERLRDHRRCLLLPIDVSISVQDDGDIHIDSDVGCLCRPLLRADRIGDFLRAGDAAGSVWNRLTDAGIIEYLDKAEERNACVALKPSDVEHGKHTHIELSPSTILGVCASLIPFAEFNQAPRNVYQSAMVKQAIGIGMQNLQRCMHSIMNQLVYPQRPLVTTRVGDILNLASLPGSSNPIVCILSSDGFNQDDSLYVNASALSRGLFNSLIFKTYEDQERMCGVDAERFERPDHRSCKGIRVASYEKLEASGIPSVGTRIEPGDAIIGKTIAVSRFEEGRRTEKRDKSTISRQGQNARVCAVLSSPTMNGHQRAVRVRVREYCVPDIGDKLCFTDDHQVLTRCGWRGVAYVCVGDEVLVFDGAGGNVAAYEPVLALHRYEAGVDGLVDFDFPVSLRVTPNHRVFVANPQEEFRRVHHPNLDAFCLKRADHVLCNGVSTHASAANHRGLRRRANTTHARVSWPMPNWPMAEKHIEAWFRFFACWLLCKKGGVRCDTRRPSHELRCSRARMRALMLAAHELRLGSLTMDHDGSLDFACEPVRSFLDVQLRCSRFFPSWCFHLPSEHAAVILHAALGTSKMVVARAAANDMMRLGVLAGVTIVAHPSRPDSPVVCIEIGTPTIRSTARAQRCSTRLPVFCVTVRTGVLAVRSTRGGCAVWCGNSSFSGQKGVIGMVRPQEDMPFTVDGIVPDVIINPHALPSRMTIGQLVETLLGKLSAVRCTIGEATPFSGKTIESISRDLHAAGYQRHGNEQMIDGVSGELMHGRVFIGPTSFQTLTHMVRGKMHARGRGAVAVMTRQPVEGRARDGGLRMGEMERDCCIAHGCAYTLRERLFEQSDAFVVDVCVTCGELCTPTDDPSGVVFYSGCACGARGDQPKPIRLPMPYAFKLMTQEASAMMIALRLKLSDVTSSNDERAEPATRVSSQSQAPERA